MTWLQRYRLKRTLSWSLWLLPVLAIGLVFVVAPFLRWLDRVTGWSWFNFTPDGARSILGAFTSSMLTFVVFVVSSLLIVVQLASAQLTPRIIALVFADRRLKWVLSVFIQRNFPDVEDRTSAQIGDLQGIGSSEPS